MDEVLVLLSASGPLTGRDLAAREPVVDAVPQVFGERVVICRLDANDQAAVTAMPGVAGVFSGAVPPDLELPADLTGRLAIDAWNSRHRVAAVPAERLGEGAAWDDPRFEREGRPTSDEFPDE